MLGTCGGARPSNAWREAPLGEPELDGLLEPPQAASSTTVKAAKTVSERTWVRRCACIRSQERRAREGPFPRFLSVRACGSPGSALLCVGLSGLGCAAGEIDRGRDRGEHEKREDGDSENARAGARVRRRWCSAVRRPRSREQNFLVVVPIAISPMNTLVARPPGMTSVPIHLSRVVQARELHSRIRPTNQPKPKMKPPNRSRMIAAHSLVPRRSGSSSAAAFRPR